MTAEFGVPIYKDIHLFKPGETYHITATKEGNQLTFTAERQLHEFVSRICAAVKHWTDRYAGETLLIASHGLVFRALAESLLGKRTSSRNSLPFHFKPNGKVWELSRITEADQ